VLRSDEMTATVDFYYGLGSRYSYLAATRIEALAHGAGAVVCWRPIYSADLMAARGQNPFGAAPASGQYDWAYRRWDAECWAAFYGVPYVEPEGLDYDPRRLALACVAAPPAARAALSRRLFAAVFAEGRSRIADADVATLAGEAGLDGRTLLARIDTAETAAAHARTIAEAVAAGAFGVPTFVVEGRAFWGNDRLPLLAAFLAAPPERRARWPLIPR
jgi:2-hydroxychromene-2-carboxylate isomerase